MPDLLLNALKSSNNGRPPVWLMRQAGRYMPSYRALKEKYSFHDFCLKPELITQITLMPIEQLDVDAAILFSDILLPLQALGLKVTYEEKIGPKIYPAIRTREQVENLQLEPMENCFKGIPLAIDTLRNTLKVPLLGFAGAPFTLASYVIEGETGKDLRHTKEWMVSDPQGFQMLLDLMAEVSIAFLHLQIKAGVQAVQLFDTWAQALSPAQFEQYSIKMMRKVKDALPPDIPVIFFSRGGVSNALMMAKAGPEAISVDWTVDLASLKNSVPPSLSLQGNLDPAWLYAPPEKLVKAVKDLLATMQNHPGFIFNLGHGILPDVPYSNVKLLVDTVKYATY